MASIVITAGPTREYLDDVRYLSNGSSGRMGCALAAAALAAGHTPTLVLGPVAIEPPAGVTVVPVVSALEMQQAAVAAFEHAEVAIAAAAVSDYRPVDRKAGKPPRAAERIQIDLVRNPDIVAGLGSTKASGSSTVGVSSGTSNASGSVAPRVVVGFALESTSAGLPAAIARGREKLRHKHLDFVVVNLHDAIDATGSEVVLCFADGRDERLPRQDKSVTARRIVDAAVALHESGRAG